MATIVPLPVGDYASPCEEVGDGNVTSATHLRCLVLRARRALLHQGKVRVRIVELVLRVVLTYPPKLHSGDLAPSSRGSTEVDDGAHVRLEELPLVVELEQLERGPRAEAYEAVDRALLDVGVVRLPGEP